MKSTILICFTSITLASCGSLIQSFTQKVPSEKEVQEMIVGKTPETTVKEKYSGSRLAAIGGMNCYNWSQLGAGASLGIEAGTHQVALCFENGLLKTKQFN